MKYRVKLIFRYSDVVHVEAENEKEAEKLALGECNEQYEAYVDAEISEDTD